MGASLGQLNEGRVVTEERGGHGKTRVVVLFMQSIPFRESCMGEPRLEHQGSNLPWFPQSSKGKGL